MPACSWQRSRSAVSTTKDQIKVAPGDEITVSYLDKENTDPGVPVERTYSVAEASGEAVKGLVYRTSVKQIEDTSEQAEARGTGSRPG